MHQKIAPVNIEVGTYVCFIEDGDFEGVEENEMSGIADWWKVVHIERRYDDATIAFELYNGDLWLQNVEDDDDRWIVSVNANGTWMRDD